MLCTGHRTPQEPLGQISFGGRAEPQDPGLEETALRETREEIGLAGEYIERSAGLATTIRDRVSHRWGLVTPPFELKPDPDEVDEVFEVPLPFLLDPGNLRRHSRKIQGEVRHFFAIPWGDYYIWGATAGMLVNLHRLLAR